jgi:hypothetical protein
VIPFVDRYNYSSFPGVEGKHLVLTESMETVLQQMEIVSGERERVCSAPKCPSGVGGSLCAPFPMYSNKFTSPT